MHGKKHLLVLLALSAALTLTGCAGPGVKSAEELRSRAEQSSGFEKNSLRVDASFRDVVSRMAVLSSCLNVKRTSKYYHHTYYTDLQVNAGEAHLTMQKQETEGLFIVTTTPREHGYLAVIDAEAAGDAATRVDIYLPEDSDRLNRVFAEHMRGTARGCPHPEMLSE